MVKMRIIKTVLMLCIMSSAVLSDEFRWGNVMIGGGGFVSAIITSKTQPNLIYARTDVGGAYRWNESAQSWIPISDWINSAQTSLYGIDALALDPQNPSRVYMFAGTSYWNIGLTAILRSDDYGETFDVIDVTSQFKTDGNGMGRQNGERLAVDPNNADILFVGTRDNGLFRSADRGSTWMPVAGAPTLANNLGICLVLFDPNRITEDGRTARIFIGLSRTADNLYMSDDGGATWEAISLPTLSRAQMPQRAVLTPGGRFLYVATAAYAGPHGNGPSRGALLRYDTQDKSWKNVSPENLVDDPAPQRPEESTWDAYLGGVGGISISPQDTNFIVASTINGWKPQIWDNAARNPAWGDKIYASYDGGETWVNVFGGISDADANNTTGNEQIAVLYKNGFNWIEGESIHWTGSVEIDPFNPKRVFATSGNGIYMADNFSPGERFRFNFTVRGIEETVPMDVVSIPGGPLVTVILDYDGFVHDDITKPVSGTRHSPRMGCTHSLDFAKMSPNVVVRAGGYDRAPEHNDYRFPIYYSLDTARTWTQFVSVPAGRPYAGKVVVSSDGRVVLWKPEQGDAVHRTDDWGATWTTSSGLSAYVKADPLDPAIFYAVSNGFLRSDDTGKTFTRVSVRDFSWVPDMQVTPGRNGHVWVGGFAWDGINGGFLARSTDGGTTFHNVDPESNPAYTQRIQHAEAIGFGKAAPGEEYPAIYVYGTIGDQSGIWQSTDEAKTWVRIDDERYGFGALANGGFLRGDMNTFGVVYRSTAGRGIAARMPANGTNVWQSAVKRPQLSPHVRLRGRTLAVTPPNGVALTVIVYDLRGRMIFNNTYNAEVTLRPRDMVRARGSYIVQVRDAAKETVFRGKMTVVGRL